MGLAVFKVAARDVRAEHVKQGHYLVDEVVQQTPLSRADIERDALRNSPTFLDEKANASAKRRASGKT